MAGSGVSMDSGLAVTDWIWRTRSAMNSGERGPDVHVDVGGALFVLRPGQLEQAGNVVRRRTAYASRVRSR